MRVRVVIMLSCMILLCADVWAAGGVYQVGVVRHDGARATGSAVQLAPGQLVCNCHTLRDATQIFVLHPNRPFNAKVEKVDEFHDLCLLRTAKFSGSAPERVSSSALSVGESVSAFGFAPGFSPSVARGNITALHRYDGARVIRTSARFPPGASGGGLYDARGRLIGVLTFRARREDLNYAVPMEWVERLLTSPDSDVSQISKRSFWEDRSIEQPKFLVAPRMEYEERWYELVDLVNDWITDDPQDHDAWMMLGRARIGLKEYSLARQALEHALVLQPDSALAWFWFANACRAVADEACMRHARARVEALDSDLSEALRAGSLQ